MKNRKTDFNAYEETSKKRRTIVPLPQVNQLRDQRCLSRDLNHNCVMALQHYLFETGCLLTFLTFKLSTYSRFGVLYNITAGQLLKKTCPILNCFYLFHTNKNSGPLQ